MLDQSGNVKRAFWAVDEKISSLLQHRYLFSCPKNIIVPLLLYSYMHMILDKSASILFYRLCPSIIRVGYGKLTAIIAKQVQV